MDEYYTSILYYIHYITIKDAFFMPCCFDIKKKLTLVVQY